MYETKQGLSDRRIGVHSFSRAIQELLPRIRNPIQRLSKKEGFRLDHELGNELSLCGLERWSTLPFLLNNNISLLKLNHNISLIKYEIGFKQATMLLSKKGGSRSLNAFSSKRNNSPIVVFK